MATIKISATKARNTFFTLLDQVGSGTQVIIKKDNREIAILTPQKKKTDWQALLTSSKEVRGIFKDYKPLDNPLRKPSAANFLGKWDKVKKSK